ncbi:disulfide bond formation protein B [Pseudomonas guariconensis]|uniref:disulfide bond formation protein B n=1 Tax=Pseudomonas TaxID=286 RepID=UPI001CE3C162|nr:MULTISPECIES: disulfide bond formation protein B [Pseudomonas]MCO7637182.1 disulfide bond formation protein B [Pseudomonas sp. S 311-6]MCO7515322.1 disulfide bond formation protein B [Pseudomonas putida]MCO7565725.1 disulfide bond formation protein B [Pseudomonas mosselii]MCO7593427.1 disulfide bond formation protein B [Pseudomonas guariconensis]MCO7605097.1 disulfide bond formation protein B [Pseudomonas guariconensis]
MLLARLHTFFLPAWLASLAVLAASFHLESVLGLVPCPLCFSQRFLLGLYSLVCLCAVIHHPGSSGRRAYCALALACSLGGALLAARHVWLQGGSMPLEACHVPFQQVLEQSWGQALKMLLLGGPDCDSLTWSFLDLTLPEWSLLAFLLLSALPLSWLLRFCLRRLGNA